MSGLTRAKILGGALVALTALIGAAGSPGADKAAKKAPPALNNNTRLPASAKLDSLALAKHIDAVIEQRARAEKVDLSPRADDAEFLRRVSLDLTGRIPTAEQATAFLDSTDPVKRRKLIDELLASKEFGKRMGDLWSAPMLPRSSDNARLRQYYGNLVKWLEESFNANKPWDKMVHEILTVTGPVDKTSPAVYYLANGPTVDKVTDNVTRLFLGVQLQCAQCHNHPFTDWKQNEYWGMAAFFTKTGPNGNAKAAAKAGNTISIVETVGRGPGGKRRLPDSAKIVPPKFLQGASPRIGAGDPLRPLLADWMTSADNIFFSKAMVNRTWGQLFGRGIVNPVDDMHDGNAPSHPELLADLAKQFSTNGFDVKYLMRAICNSAAYQRTSKPTGNNGDASAEMFARAAVRPLSPEQQFDSLTQVVGAGKGPGFARKGGGAGRAGPGTPRQAFVTFFQLEDGADPTEYQAGIPQVLRLMNAPQFNNAAILGPILRESSDWKKQTEKLYLATLARRPTEADLARVDTHLRRNPTDRRQGMADVLWALINTSEFALNH